MPGLNMWVDENHVLRGPGVSYQPIPEATSSAIIRPWSVIRHSQAGPKKTLWNSLRAYWYRTDITIEAHAIVNMDGTIVQVMPFNRRADCNAKANSWIVDGYRVGALSYETQDNGSATLAATPWAPAQREAICQMDAALSAAYGIPVVGTPVWNGRGFEGHYRFKEWSVYQGKTCPGAARIAQQPAMLDRIRELLIPEPVRLPDVVEVPKEDMFMRIRFDVPSLGSWIGFTYNGYNLDWSDGGKDMVDGFMGVEQKVVDKPTMMALLDVARKVTGFPGHLFGDPELDAKWRAKANL